MIFMLNFKYNLFNFPPVGRLSFQQLNYDTPSYFDALRLLDLSGQGDFLEDPFEVGDGDAVVGHGRALAPALHHAREHELAVKHAAAAMDDEIIASHILGEVFACHNVYTQAVSHALSQQTRNFHPSDVLGERGMGAGLGDEHARLFSQAVDGQGAPDKETDITLVGRHEYRERGEQCAFGLFLLHDVKHL